MDGYPPPYVSDKNAQENLRNLSIPKHARTPVAYLWGMFNITIHLPN